MTDTPADWTKTTLGALGVMNKGTGIKRSEVRPSGVPCIRYGELYTEFQNYTATTSSFVDEDVALAAQRIRKGDLLFAGSGETREEIGMCAAYVGDAPAVAGGDIIILRGGSFNPIYLGSLANSEAVASQKARAGQGDAVVHLYARGLSEVEVVLPPRAEQDAIADAIVDADDLIVTLERLIAKKQAIKQGMMQQLLTGRTRLPGFDGRWQDSNLGSVASVTMGQSPAGSTYNSDARGLPLVQGNADIRGRVTFDRIWTSAPTRTCEAGDVLLTVRAPVGYTAIASKRSCLGRGVCSISADHDNRFIFHALMYAEPAWALYEQGSTFTAVNSNVVRSFALFWPADPDERQAIARVLDDTDKELASLQARLAKARSIKSGMMQQLLTGRTRLPEDIES